MAASNSNIEVSRKYQIVIRFTSLKYYPSNQGDLYSNFVDCDSRFVVIFFSLS